jgi:hypothetical protein
MIYPFLWTVFHLNTCLKFGGHFTISLNPKRKKPSMHMAHIPFGTTDWSAVVRVEKAAQAGQAFWRTQQFGDVRVRMVEYTPGYVSDHWCVKGHILLCMQGELHTELQDGRTFTLRPGMSYQVADNAEPHRSTSPLGATLFIVD